MAEDKKETPKKEVAVKAAPFTIAPGKSILTNIGQLEAGAEIKAEHLTNGKKDLDTLVKCGAVLKA